MCKTVTQQDVDAALRVKVTMPMVVKAAKIIHSKLPASVELDDLIQAGMIGLLTASKRFDEKHGVPFSVFAAQRVKGSIIDSLRDTDWMPKSLRGQLRNVELVLRKLEHKLHRRPTNTEAASEMNMTLVLFNDLLSRTHVYEVKIDDLPIGAADVPDDAAGPLEIIINKECRDTLAEEVSKLPLRDRQILSLYYTRDYSQLEISKVLFMSESAISLRRTNALAILHNKIKNHG